MNSFERVKAALTFFDPDRVPVMNSMNAKRILFESDVFTLAPLPSSNYRPGFGEGEEGFFPRPVVPFARLPVPEWRKLPEWKKKRKKQPQLPQRKGTSNIVT